MTPNETTPQPIGPQPSNPMRILVQYEEELANIVEKWGDNAVLAFRGQSDAKWPLNSSAQRRLEDDRNEISMIKYLDEHLLKPAQREGYDHQENKKRMNDLELLAALQHQGAATCLIDFTTNFHIALWFACQEAKDNESREKDGKIFIINHGLMSKFINIDSQEERQFITDFLEKPSYQNQSVFDPENTKECIASSNGLRISSCPNLSSSRVYYWKPPSNKNRIVAQYSCFVFTTNGPINEELYEKISIKAGDKKEILSLLEKYYSLDHESIFRDFAGFASLHGLNKPIKPVINKELALTAVKLCKQEKYQEAIDYCTKAIKINPNNATVYYYRGLAKIWLEQYREAIEDFTKAIDIEPDNATVYYYGLAKSYCYRGLAKIWLCQYPEAIKDFTKAIDIKSDYVNAYRWRGRAYKESSNLPKARRDLQKALRLATDQNNQTLIEFIKQSLNDLPPENQKE